MIARGVAAKVGIAAAAAPTSPPLGDLRFRRLVGEADWVTLPEAVRARFAHRAAGGHVILYAGEIVEAQRSRCGWWLTQAARLVGAPLPLGCEIGVPAAVSVTEDPATGGQCWTRIYGRRRGFPQAIHSAKRFAGPTGLEEYLGLGFGIALVLRVEAGALHFDSDHYFLRIGSVRLRLPHWLAPGRMRVSHVDLGDGQFAFILALHHPWLGALVHQVGIFHERPERGDAP
ncbi:DUF4166 domain-containing protein [Sphingosinicella sp. BN140058]|uniref:DUF4166 domain-containing protein n=1 Tax=Sphingosinicella sp. BN140058 TaxID=1892855 RepID=UPI001012441C|nr:DUF4166 domain-containing protein [Sphingosinicella sp. BN140058]QAY76379.1 DUF4166 domain-containing protein [Sphingosinicella sp. BN140058]